MGEIHFLTQEEILVLHADQIRLYGGDMGLRDEGLLESACHAPQFAHFYEDADIPRMAAILLFALCKNHPFVDGNKRTALAAAVVFCDANELTFDESVTDRIMVDVVLSVAEGRMDKDRLAEFLAGHLVPNFWQ